MAGGRPTKYDGGYHPKLAYKLCLLGHTNNEIAEFFDVNIDTIYEWQKIHEEFSDALTRGKVVADAKVAQAVYKAAIGFRHKETKFFVSGMK